MTDVSTVSTEQLIGAIAQTALTFAGPAGVVASSFIPQLEQAVEAFRNGPATYSLEDLAAIVQGNMTKMQKVKSDIDAMP